MTTLAQPTRGTVSGMTLTFVCAAILLGEFALVFVNTFDDAFITFRYGQHLSDGAGLVWNRGEAPVEGYTSTLGVIVAAASTSIGVYPLLAAKLIGVVAALVTLGLILHAGHVLTRRERVIASGLLLLSPDVAYHSISGMENAWVLPIVTYLAIRHLEPSSFTRSTMVGVSAAMFVLCLLRPEGHLIAGLFLALHAWRWYRGELSTGLLWAVVGPVVAGLVLLHGARFLWFGSLLPNTYYAKHTGGAALETLFSGLLYLAQHFFAVYGVPWLLAVWEALRSRTVSSRVHLALLFAFPLFVLQVGGDDSSFGGARLLLPILPILWLGAAQFTASIVLPRKSAGGALLAIAVVGAAINANWYVGTTRELYAQTALSPNVVASIRDANLKHARDLVAPALLPMSQYLAATVPPGEYIAIPWAGRIPFETGLPTIDLLGLNDRHIAHLKKNERGVDVKYDAAYVLARRPQIICENVRVRGMNMEDFAGMSDADLHAIGAIKVGQRDLIRSPVLAEEYVIDSDAPAPGCFVRRK